MKKYIDCFVPIYNCNFKCHYCYVSLLDQFEINKQKFPRSANEIIKALSKERLGEDVYINLCAGGETLLMKDSVELVRGLLEEGHHVSVVTNGSINSRFDEIKEFPRDLLEKIFFKFSFHYLELKRLNKLADFFNNVKKMRNVGASFTIEITPNDELIPYIDSIKKLCIEKVGALPHCTIGRDDRRKGIDILTDMSFEDYVKTWSVFDSDLFKYKLYLYKNKVEPFCYAGAWSYYINLATGDVRPCNCGDVFANIYDNTDIPLPVKAMGNSCRLPYCYNGHSWISLGVNPEMEHPIYTNLRNRVCEDGTEWITSEYKKFWQKQLFVDNDEYSAMQKGEINRMRYVENLSPRNLLRRLLYMFR